jgi:hypothetical protein
MSDDVAKHGKGGAPGGFWLEIYKDMFQPAARVTGSVLEDFARTLNRSGLEFGAEGREHVRRLIERAKLGVPDARLALPPPPILGRIVESIRYEPEGTPLYEMFERLLASSMDSERIHLVHPSFAVILGHLCSDEVRILEGLSKADIPGEWSDWSQISGPIPPEMEAPKGLLEQPQAFDLYYANLASLSLAILTQDEERSPDGFSWHFRWRLTLQGMGTHLMAACKPLTSSSETLAS